MSDQTKNKPQSTLLAAPRRVAVKLAPRRVGVMITPSKPTKES